MLQSAAQRGGAPIRVDSLYPPSDHLSFRDTRTRSYAITLLDLSEIDGMLSAFRGQAPFSPATARILGIIHTPDDTLEQLDPAAISWGARIVEQAIRDLDTSRARP